MFPALEDLITCKADCSLKRKLKCNVVCVIAVICGSVRVVLRSRVGFSESGSGT